MKITATLSFLALLPTIGAQCEFCPSGISEGNATVLPETNGTTCGEFALFATIPNITTEFCGEIKTGGHLFCCPTDVGPGCDFCATGVEEAEFVLTDDGTTCGDLGVLKTFAAQELCASFTLGESVCCPEKTGTVCDDLCPGGVTAPEVMLDFGDGDTATCAEVAQYTSILSSDTELCSESKFSRATCCPDDVGPGCPFCEGGVSSAETVVDEEEGVTCADLKELAPIAPQDQCANLGLAQFLCCPPTQAPASTDAPTTAPVVAPTTAPADAAVGLSTMFGLIATALIGFLYV